MSASPEQPEIHLEAPTVPAPTVPSTTQATHPPVQSAHVTHTRQDLHTRLGLSFSTVGSPGIGVSELLVTQDPPLHLPSTSFHPTKATTGPGRFWNPVMEGEGPSE